MSSLSIMMFVGTMALSLWAAWRVKSVYRRYLQVPALSGITGAEAAARMLQHAGIRDVEIVAHNEMLGDHYDPTHKRLVLSNENYHGTSVAALGVAAHEAGHALQHKEAYAPLHWRMAAVGMTNIASQIAMWLPMLGLFTGMISPYTAAWILSLAWGVIMIFNLVTLPVEFDASRRAKIALGNMGMVTSRDEANGVSAVLNAAAWTYVAAFITSLGYLLIHLLPLLTGGKREE
ncbi:zinc metallopeptidase [soil metagenome]